MLIPELQSQIERDLERDEGRRRKAYRDTVGKLTIGVGRNLDDKGLRDDEINLMLRNDIKEAESELDRTQPWWRDHPAAVQGVLLNLMFNLGATRLGKFITTLSLIKRRDYRGAANQLRRTLYARQVGQRAERLAKILEIC